MILQSRKWRLLIRTIVLILASAFMLAAVAPVSYALKDDRPILVTSIAQLYDEAQPIADLYVYTLSVPDLGNVVSTDGIGTTYYWLPLPGYDHKLFVRTEGDSFIHTYLRAQDLNMREEPRESRFYGKVTPLKSQAGADEAIEALAANGVEIDKESAMVILQGEKPSVYRPIVPMAGFAVMLWALTLVGLFNILSGRRQRKRNA